MQYNRFVIAVFEQKPGKWRAKISRKDGRHLKIEGRWGRKLVTTFEVGSHSAALRAAMVLIDAGSVIAPDKVPIEKFWRLSRSLEPD